MSGCLCKVSMSSSGSSSPLHILLTTMNRGYLHKKIFLELLRQIIFCGNYWSAMLSSCSLSATSWAVRGPCSFWPPNISDSSSRSDFRGLSIKTVHTLISHTLFFKKLDPLCLLRLCKGFTDEPVSTTVAGGHQISHAAGFEERGYAAISMNMSR